MSKVQKNCSIHLLIISRKLRISQILFVLLSQYSENILNSPQIRNLLGLVGFCLQSDKIHFIVHISCTTEMSQTQNPLTP